MHPQCVSFLQTSLLSVSLVYFQFDIISYEFKNDWSSEIKKMNFGTINILNSVQISTFRYHLSSTVVLQIIPNF